MSDILPDSFWVRLHARLLNAPFAQRWYLRPFRDLKNLPHSLHKKCTSVLWVRQCCLNVLSSEKWRPQSMQPNGFSPVWIRSCLTTFRRFLNNLPQCLHSNWFSPSLDLVHWPRFTARRHFKPEFFTALQSSLSPSQLSTETNSAVIKETSPSCNNTPLVQGKHPFKFYLTAWYAI
jgi:hypothetical protein